MSICPPLPFLALLLIALFTLPSSSVQLVPQQAPGHNRLGALAYEEYSTSPKCLQHHQDADRRGGVIARHGRIWWSSRGSHNSSSQARHGPRALSCLLLRGQLRLGHRPPAVASTLKSSSKFFNKIPFYLKNILSEGVSEGVRMPGNSKGNYSLELSSSRRPKKN